MNIKVTFKKEIRDYDKPPRDTNWGREYDLKKIVTVEGMLVSIFSRQVYLTQSSSETMGVVVVDNQFNIIKLNDLTPIMESESPAPPSAKDD